MKSGSFCGTSTVGGMVDADGTGIMGSIETCFAITDLGPLDDIGDLISFLGDVDPTTQIDDLCVSVTSNQGFMLDSCSVMLGNQACACNICPSAKSDDIDCSGINISPAGDLFPINIPRLNFCTFLDFTPETST